MRVARFMPNARFTLRPHPTLSKLTNAQPELGRRSSKANQARSIRRIAVIGAIVSHKGSRLLQDVARFAKGEKLPMHFSLIGYTDRNRALSALDNVDISGPYEPDQEESLLAHADADLVWFPYVIPETYSYTLSTALHAGLFPIAFDFGAVAERLRAISWGELLPYELMLDPPEVARRLMEAKITPAPADLRQGVFIEYEQPVTVSYYGFASWPPAKERGSALTS
jgi:glycosyltransferase involved in cell wall biosynthesis